MAPTTSSRAPSRSADAKSNRTAAMPASGSTRNRPSTKGWKRLPPYWGWGCSSTARGREHLQGSRCVGQRPGRCTRPFPDDADDRRPDRGGLEPAFAENLGGVAPGLAEEGEEQVLGADVAVTEVAGGEFAGRHH